MGIVSELLHSYPKQLTAQHLDQLRCDAHKEATGPKAPAGQVQQKLLKRYKGGVHYAPSNGSAKGRREARKAYALVIAQLETPAAQQRYGRENAQQALGSLQKFGPELTPEEFDRALAPVSTASRNATVAASAQKVLDGVKALRATGLPVGGPTPPVDWSTRPKGRAVRAWQQAFAKEVELMKAQTRRKSDGLGSFVEPGLGDLELAKGQTLGTLFAQALGHEAWTKNVKLESLHEILVVQPFKRISELGKQLDDLLTMDKLPGDADRAGLDNKIIQRSQELMACVADTHERMAQVADRLGQGLPQQLPGRMSEELVQLSLALTTLASEGLAPNSHCMQAYQRAQEQYLLALGRRADTKVQEAAQTLIQQADGWLRGGLDPRNRAAVIDDSSAVQQDQSAARCEHLSRQARTAAARFASLLPPANTAVPPTRKQKELQRRLDAALDRLPLTRGLRAEVPDLNELLFEVLPLDLDDRMKDLRDAQLRAQSATGNEAIAAHEDLRAQSEELMLMISQYVQALATVGYVLANGVPREDLPFDEQRIIQNFARSLIDLASAVSQPHSERMRNFKEGHEAFQTSLQALQRLRFKPGVKPASPAQAAPLAPQRTPNARFYAEIDRQLDELLAADEVPSPRRAELSTEAELKQFQALSDAQWLDTVNNIASPGLQKLDNPKQVVQTSLPQALPATRLYMPAERKGRVRRRTKDQGGPAKAAPSASSASKNVGADAAVSRVNGLPRWSRTASPLQSVVSQGLPTGSLRMRREDVQVPRLMPDLSNTRSVPSERRDVDTRPLTEAELADAMGQSIEQTRAILRREVPSPVFRVSDEADRTVAPPSRKPRGLGQADRPLAEFVRLAFEPRDGQQGLSKGQKALKQALDSKLKELFPAPSPDASELHRVLAAQRASLAQQRRALRAMLGAPVPAEQLSKAAKHLSTSIDRHLFCPSEVGRWMADSSTGDPDLGAAMKAAGTALLSEELRLRQPDSSLMKHRRAAVKLQTGF